MGGESCRIAATKTKGLVNEATVAAILATFAALGARADEINLKSLAVNWDDSGTTKFVLGTGDYSDSTWSRTKERVFDGVIELDNGGTPDWPLPGNGGQCGGASPKPIANGPRGAAKPRRTDHL